MPKNVLSICPNVEVVNTPCTHCVSVSGVPRSPALVEMFAIFSGDSVLTRHARS